MACPGVEQQPYIQLINEAFVLAGASSAGNPLSAADVLLGISVLNQVLGIWSGLNQFLFYEDVFDFLIEISLENYRLGTISSAEIKTNPFQTITSLNYRIGGVDYGCQFTPWKSYNLIPQKNIEAYPTNYTYQYYGTYTLLRIFPKPPIGTIIKVTGKQILLDASLFTSSTAIPPHARTALIYFMAKMLLQLGKGVKTSGFDNDFTFYFNMFCASNKQSNEYEVFPPFLSSKTSAKGAW